MKRLLEKYFQILRFKKDDEVKIKLVDMVLVGKVCAIREADKIYRIETRLLGRSEIVSIGFGSKLIA